MNKQEYNEQVTKIARECLSLARDEHQGAAILSEAIDLAFELADDVVGHGPKDVIEHSENDDAIFASGHEVGMERLGLKNTVDGILEELAFWAARADIINKINELHEGDGKEHHFRTRAGNLVIIEADGRVTLDFSEVVRCFSGIDETIKELKEWRSHAQSPEEHRDHNEMLEVLYTFASQKD